MYELIQILIEERDLSDITRDRLEKISEKYKELEEECTQLALDYEDMQDKFARAKARIALLEEQIEIQHQKGLDALNEVEIRILEVLFKRDTSLTFNQLCEACKMERGLLRHCLDVLKDANLVSSGVQMRVAISLPGDPTVYSLTKEGRALLVKRMNT